MRSKRGHSIFQLFFQKASSNSEFTLCSLQICKFICIIFFLQNICKTYFSLPLAVYHNCTPFHHWAISWKIVGRAVYAKNYLHVPSFSTALNLKQDESLCGKCNFIYVWHIYIHMDINLMNDWFNRHFIYSKRNMGKIIQVDLEISRVGRDVQKRDHPFCINFK